MISQRYVKGQKTRLRRLLEEESKKIKESLEEVRENGEPEVDLKDLKETVCTYVTRFKETTEKLSMLIDEEGDEEKIKSREKEEEEEFNFLKDVEGLICKVNSTFEEYSGSSTYTISPRESVNEKLLSQIINNAAKAENRNLTAQRSFAEKLIQNQQNLEGKLLQLYFQEEKKMPGQTTHEHKQIERRTNKQTNQAIKEAKQDNDKAEQMTQELKQIEMKTNKQIT